jgi:hypothetical protein
MSFLVFIPLVFSVGVCLVPLFLLRRQATARTQDYCVSSQPTPPAVIRNSSIAYSLRVATFGPFFAWGASGDIWPAIVSAVFLGLGLLLIYLLRRPLLEFLDGALSRDRSITVHAFIARHHGNDPRVCLLAASLTLFAFFGLIVGEAIAVAALLTPLLMGNAALVYLSVLGMLTLMVLCTILPGNSGVMHSAQLHLGMAYLGLFGSTALLLYLHVSALTPMPPHVTFAVVFVATWCALILWYRRSKYVDTTPVHTHSGRPTSGAVILKKLVQILNPCISVFAVLVVVVAFMEFYFAGLPTIARDITTALQAGTRMPSVGLIALVLLPLFYPIVDVANWQRIAAIEKDGDPAYMESSGGSAALRQIFRMCAVEGPVLLLFMCMFGAIAVVATEPSTGADVMQAFMAQLVLDQNEVTVIALPLLLVSVCAIALSAMISMFSASICTIRYDILPWFGPEPASDQAQPADEAIATRRATNAGVGFFAAIAASFLIAEASLQIDFASNIFLALLFAFCCAQLSFVPLVLGPVIGRRHGAFGTVSPHWAMAILGSGAASAAGVVTVYLATGSEAWLWAAVPVCLGSGLLLFTIAWLWHRKTPRQAAGPA